MQELNRRKFLGLSAVGTGVALLGAAGCNAFPVGNGESGETAKLFAEIAAQAQTENEGSGDAESFADNIATAATHFLDALTEAQHSQATYAFTDAERTRWHWTTPGNFPRNGLPLREMNEDQKVRALELLQASLSGIGLEKAVNIMTLQRDLGNDPEL